MRPIELTIDPEFLVTIDVLGRREGPPAERSEEDKATYWKQMPTFHSLVVETLGETLTADEIAAMYAAAERASASELRQRLRDLTAGRDRESRRRQDVEMRRIARASALYDNLWNTTYSFEEKPGEQLFGDPYETARYGMMFLLNTLCP